MAKVMISLPDQLKKIADHYAEIKFKSRSELVRDALRHYLVIQQNQVTLEGSVARRQRLRKMVRGWRKMGKKYGLANLTELVINEREKLAKRWT